MLKKSFSILFIIFLFSLSSFAQRVISGQVTQVIDGKTIVIQSSAGLNQNFTAQIQYIEIPESTQPLSSVVKDHLEKLLLNKTVSLTLRQMAQSKMIGKVLLGSVDVGAQLIRDGAAWYALPESASQGQFEREDYLTMETAAKAEKRGVWGIAGLKPSWEFRAEQEELKRKQAEAELKKAQEESAKLAALPKVKKPYVSYTIPVILPDKIQNAIFIDAEAQAPKGFVVVGVGYLSSDTKKLLKAVKKPVSGDMTCVDYDVPSNFAVTQYVLSDTCPNPSGNNANYIVSKAVLAKQFTGDAIDKSILAFRMYKISGNYLEFQPKAYDARDAITKAAQYLPDGNLKNYLLYTSDTITDCLAASQYRMRDLGAEISGSFLIRLNDKYKLDDVSAGELGNEIYRVGNGYLTQAISEAKRNKMY